jgi:hypothetical protein
MTISEYSQRRCVTSQHTEERNRARVREAKQVVSVVSVVSPPLYLSISI